jgi:hypothetical protein
VPTEAEQWVRDVRTTTTGDGGVGGGGGAVWAYRGKLVDPLTGRTVAAVEGLEWSTALPLPLPPTAAADEEEEETDGTTATVAAPGGAPCREFGDLAIARALKRAAKKMEEEEEEKSTDDDGGESGSATATTSRRRWRRRGRGRGRGQDAGTSLLPTKAGEPVVSDCECVDHDDDGDDERGAGRPHRDDDDYDFDYAGTLLSRRIFCYLHPPPPPGGGGTAAAAAAAAAANSHGGGGTAAGLSLLLDRVRRRPGGPATPVPVEQAVTLYDTATTVLQRRRRSGGSTGTGAPTTTSTAEWLLHTEFPDGRCTWGDASVVRTVATAGPSDDVVVTTVEWDVYSRPPRKEVAGTWMLPWTTTERKKRDAADAPRRSALVQFGLSSQQRSAEFGARETYRYTATASREAPRSAGLLGRLFRRPRSKGTSSSPPTAAATVRYTRYGEGPAWYGPGRPCALELSGRRIDAAGPHLPPTAARAAAKYAPDLWSSVRAALRNQDARCPPVDAAAAATTATSSRDAVKAFRERKQPFTDAAASHRSFSWEKASWMMRMIRPFARAGALLH